MKLKFTILPKSHKILGFNDTIFFMAGGAINTFFMMVILYNDMLIHGPYDHYMVLYTIECTLMFTHWYCMRLYYLNIVAAFPGFANSTKRIIRLPLVLVFYYTVAFILDFLLVPLLNIKAPNQGIPPFSTELVAGTVMSIVNIGIYEGLHLFVELKNTKIRKAILEKEKMDSRLDSLKHQMDPFFLFYGLNNVFTLIDHDKEKSKEYVLKLSNLYQTTLQLSKRSLVTVEEELSYFKEYMALVKNDGKNTLKLKHHINGQSKSMMVPLSLQIGMKNVIRNLILKKIHQLVINITTQDQYLVISYSCGPESPNSLDMHTIQQGLAERYQQYTPDEIVSEYENKSYFLKIPLLNL